MNITTTIVGNTLKFAFDSSATASVEQAATPIRDAFVTTLTEYVQDHPYIAAGAIAVGVAAVGYQVGKVAQTAVRKLRKDKPQK